MCARQRRTSRAQAVHRVPGARGEGYTSGHSAPAGHVSTDGHGVRESVLALVFPDTEGAFSGDADGEERSGMDYDVRS